MSRYYHRVVVTFLLFAILSSGGSRASYSEESSVLIHPEDGCDSILALLDAFLVDRRKGLKGPIYVVARPGPTSPPGKILQHLRFVEGYLTDRVADAGVQVLAGIGSTRERLSFEVFTLPVGAPRPLIVPFSDRYGTIVGKYDEGDLFVMKYKGSWTLGAAICSLENVYLHGMAEAVAALPGARGYVLVYPGREPSWGGPQAAVAAVRHRLIETHALRPQQVRVVLGPRRGDHPSAELWVVPAGEQPPGPRA